MVVDDNPYLRLLIYINESNEPKRVPWGSLAETSAQDEDWPFKATPDMFAQEIFNKF